MKFNRAMLGVYSGTAFFLLWGAGLVVTGWLPPISAALDAPAVAAVVQASSLRILLGVAIMTVTAALYLPWTVLLSGLIEPIEAPSKILTRTQLIAGVMAQVTFFLPPFFWAVAAYRPFRAPEITQGFVDAGWLIFITGIGPFILQYVTLSIAIFSDQRAVPAFPRWAGYLQIWISVSFIPAIVPFFLKTGPFAWNGIFVWWLPLTIFAGWFVAMMVLAYKAVQRSADIR